MFLWHLAVSVSETHSAIGSARIKDQRLHLVMLWQQLNKIEMKTANKATSLCNKTHKISDFIIKCGATCCTYQCFLCVQRDINCLEAASLTLFHTFHDKFSLSVSLWHFYISIAVAIRFEPY